MYVWPTRIVEEGSRGEALSRSVCHSRLAVSRALLQPAFTNASSWEDIYRWTRIHGIVRYLPTWKKELVHQTRNNNNRSGGRTWMESAGIEPSFLRASFRSALPLIVGSLYSPSAATKIVTFYIDHKEKCEWQIGKLRHSHDLLDGNGPLI